MWIFSWNNLQFQKIALPLHSLSGTNTTVVVPVKQDDPWKHSIQTSSTTSMMCFSLLVKCKVRNEKRTVNNLKIFIPASTNNFWQVDTSYEVFTDIIYNEEFDPGSGWTLATGLTHASRGVSRELASKRRPAHGWVTRIQPALHIGIAFRKGD